MHDEFEGTTLPAVRLELSNGFALAECVGTRGERTIWLLDPDAGESTGNAGPETAPHEQDGPLPKAYRQRLGLTCGAVARSGKPCRSSVKSYGQHCTHHQAATDEPTDAERAGRLF